jgi:hypothetical protein
MIYKNVIFLLSYPAAGVIHDIEKYYEIDSLLKNAVFWDVAPCRSCVNRRFGGTYRLHLQGRKIRKLGTSVRRWLQTAFNFVYEWWLWTVLSSGI